MQTKRPYILTLVLVAIALAAAGYYAYNTYFVASASSGTLSASGTVETTQVFVAPELSGKILALNVDEGDTVKAGDELFRIDDTLLKAQKDVATAGLNTAKASAATAQAAVAAAQTQYDIAFSAAMLATRGKRTSDWYGNQAGEFTVPLWYFSQEEQLTATQSEVDAAKTAWEEAQKYQAEVEVKAASADFVKAETALAAAQARYQVANNMHERVKNGKNIDDFTKRQMFLLMKDARLIAKGVDPKWVSSHLNQDLRDAVETIFDDAKTALDDAQEAYDNALTTDGAKDVMEVRAQTSVAEERYYTAMDYVRILQTGPEAQTVTAAKNVLEQAKSAAAQAQSAVSQAEANLNLLDTQIAKTIISAPVDGVVLTRTGEPGTVVNPGSMVLTLGRIDELTITVYVPEDRMGEVKLGQTATVTVDSFPGQTFTATVTNISDQAEFTPRNVQTSEGRKTTVFAVKLSLDDSDGKLKPGMPADVSFK